MSNNKSYNLTPQQKSANEAIFKASHVVLETFKGLLSQREFHALEHALKIEGLKVLMDLHKAHKSVFERAKLLSAENECLKMVIQSVEQDRKDFQQQREWIKRLLEENEQLKNR